MSTRVYVPIGMLGYGMREASLTAAVELRPDVFSVDAGSIDPGPYYLGSGTSFTSRPLVKRDLGMLLRASMGLGVPLVIGTAGGAGAAPHVEWTLGILREVAAEAGLHPRVALIAADVDKTLLRRKLAAGDVIDFEAGTPLTPADIDACTNIVAQMGHEPITEALDAGADVVLAGRAYDASLAAALPIMQGADPGIALHMGIADCGLHAIVPASFDGMVSDVHRHHFDIAPADPAARSPAEVIANMTLYENSDPLRLPLPGGTLDVSDTTVEQVDERTSRVAGTRFHPAPRYTVKMEGAAPAGWRTVCIGGTRDPQMIRHLDASLAATRAKVEDALAGALGGAAFQLHFRLYGRNGVMGALEPYRGPDPHELGIVIEAVADTSEAARAVCAAARSTLLHMGYEGRVTTAGNLAFPFSPAELPAQEVYALRVYHLLRLDSPTEIFPISWEQL